jgi:hypothetical protein
MCNLKRNPTKITWTYNGTKMKSEAGQSSCSRISKPPPWHWRQGNVVARPLLTPVAQKLCGWEYGVFASRTYIFILEHFFLSKSSAALREAFRNAYRDKEVPSKTAVHRLVTKFRHTGSVRLWQVFIWRQDSRSYGRTNLTHCIHCKNSYCCWFFRFEREGIQVWFYSRGEFVRSTSVRSKTEGD